VERLLHWRRVVGVRHYRELFAWQTGQAFKLEVYRIVRSSNERKICTTESGWATFPRPNVRRRFDWRSGVRVHA